MCVAYLPATGPLCPSHAPQGNSWDADPFILCCLRTSGPRWVCPPSPGGSTYPLLGGARTPSLGKPQGRGGCPSRPPLLSPQGWTGVDPTPAWPARTHSPATPTRQAHRKFAISRSPRACPAAAFPPPPVVALLLQQLRRKSSTPPFPVPDLTGCPLTVTWKETFTC